MAAVPPRSSHCVLKITVVALFSDFHDFFEMRQVPRSVGSVLPLGGPSVPPGPILTAWVAGTGLGGLHAHALDRCRGAVLAIRL